MFTEEIEEVTTMHFQLEDLASFRLKAWAWGKKEEYCTYLYDHDIDYPKGGFRHLLAVGAKKVCPMEDGYSFESVQKFHKQHNTWLFGHWGYDLKNEVELLCSDHQDGIDLPDAFFYIPKTLFIFGENEVEIQSENDIELIYQEVLTTPLPVASTNGWGGRVSPKISHATYIDTVQRIQEHIVEGDVYEVNICMEFLANEADVDPFDLYLRLSHLSPAPFSAFHRVKDKFVTCSSPERFMKKEGNKVTSQPIKGTIKRGASAEEDELLKEQLQNDEKEVAENMMIVDLVRNDLARTCKAGTIKVPEIFGIYGFRSVFQMISTIEGEIKEGIPFTEVIKKAFPMGSMTGAPKVMAMALIEMYERSKRGLYSGAIGYITPEGNFDFNVVIRSALYNATDNYLSFQIGSAITIDSEAEKEYQECLLKAKGMLDALNAKIVF
ncbi:anthranilate synthase component I family protein [Flammeovirga kamogawensis]|nr:anthranilate synthase component I family protein [Flammeovirga kamogawensis]MBB6462963.1 para-aminobenzoate synthetase component 1 [Flammeovirga kamogawensis]